MGAEAVAVMISKLAPPVLDLVTEILHAVQGAKTKRDAARRVAILAAKRMVLA